MRARLRLFFQGLFLLTAAALLQACSPTFNWREVRPERTTLSALLPCKPDKAQRTVPLGGQPTELHMVGCETGGVTFAVAFADLGRPERAAEVLAGWQAATLAQMRAPASAAGSPSQVLLRLPGAASLPPPVLVSAQGRYANGRAVQGRLAYFAQGTQVFQAAMYAPHIDADVAEAFFSGLKLP